MASGGLMSTLAVANAVPAHNRSPKLLHVKQRNGCLMRMIAPFPLPDVTVRESKDPQQVGIAGLYAANGPVAAKEGFTSLRQTFEAPGAPNVPRRLVPC